MGLIWPALAKVPRPVWGALAIIVALALTYAAGGRDKAAEIEAQDMEDYRETRDRIDRATGAGGDADAARRRLREALGPR